MSKKTKHKFAGFHLWKEVCSVISENKEYAEEQCEKKLIDYFHKKTEGLTLFPLSYYNGQVCYLGAIEEPTNE